VDDGWLLRQEVVEEEVAESQFTGQIGKEAEEKKTDDKGFETREFSRVVISVSDEYFTDASEKNEEGRQDTR